ncbi:AAA family ATPase [Streptomycetaceae bacterium NBC_01309]
MLFGRGGELAALARLIEDARGGRGSALALTGPPGIGKTALLGEAAAYAEGFRILRTTGIESEAGLPFAALHQLLAPALDRIAELPEPQAAALRGAFGLARPSDDARLLVGLGLLTLLGELAEAEPVLCVVDDTQWLDVPSATALGFAARRLGAERVAVLFAVRDGEAAEAGGAAGGLAGIPTLAPAPLDAESAAAALAVRSPDLAATVRARILAESSGNPLAIHELAAALNDAQRAGAAPLPAALGARDAVARTFRGRLVELSPGARRLVTVAAAHGSSEVGTLLAAARSLGCELGDLDAAVDADVLVVTGETYAFRHPLIRSTAYQDATLTERVNAHRALADALTDASDGGVEGSGVGASAAGRGAPGRAHGEPSATDAAGSTSAPADADPVPAAVWHLALAATAPDADLAAAMERAADQAWARGGVTAAAYGQAARLAPERAERARLLMRAAQAAIVGGQTDQAVEYSHLAAELTDDPVTRGSLAMIDATAENFRGRPRHAARVLATSAERIVGSGDERDRSGSVEFAAELGGGSGGGLGAGSGSGFESRAASGMAGTLLTIAAGYAWFSDDGQTLGQVAELAGRNAPKAPITAAIRGMAALAASDPAAGIPPMAALVEHERAHPSPSLIDRMFAAHVARILGDDAAVAEFAEAEAARCRAWGTVSALPDVLAGLARGQFAAGRHRDAEATAVEALGFARETRQAHVLDDLHRIALGIAAVAGDEARCRAIAAEHENLSDDPAFALLDLGLGHYEEALTRLVAIAEDPAGQRTSAVFAIPDLVEAAVRAGHPDRAAKHLARFLAWAEAATVAWPRAVALRCRALVALAAETTNAAEAAEAAKASDGSESVESVVERLFAAAIAEHGEASRPFEFARTELLYGEWLRRARRRTDARTVLRSAEARFARLGAAPWAERARTELRAAGERGTPAAGPAEPTSIATAALDTLTPQELQVVRLAAGGGSNQDIAAQLFLSRRTVEYHLYKAYPKLGIGSRRELMRLRADA